MRRSIRDVTTEALESENGQKLGILQVLFFNTKTLDRMLQESHVKKKFGFGWKVLLHPLYSLDVAPPDYHMSTTRVFFKKQETQKLESC